MNEKLLTSAELEKIVVGEAITLAAVLAIAVIAIVMVVAYKLFVSKQGTTKLPGGYVFEWK